MAHPRTTRIVLALSSIALLTLRIPFLPPTVEDLDSVNFYGGVQHYSPPDHWPHPPGFPVFILLAKLVFRFVESPTEALALLSALAGSAACVPLYFIARRLFDARTAAAACVLTLFTPIVWFAGVRPMSDATGLLAGLTAQALLLAGLEASGRRSDRFWRLGAIAAGLAIGVRLQAVLIVGPLCLYGWLVRRRSPILGPVLFSAAVAAWLIPMIVLSGGPSRYAAAFTLVMRQAASLEPLFKHPSGPNAVRALRDTFVAPWITGMLAAVVLVLAAAGAALMIRERRRSLLPLALLFVPYALYHYLTQYTIVIRYAIPVVSLVSICAGFCLTRMLRKPALLALPLAQYVATAAIITVPALVDFHEQPSPAFQALRHVALSRSGPTVVSGTSVFARYLPFAAPGLEVVSPAGGFDWAIVTDYWQKGGRSPMYFLHDPGRDVRPFLSQDAYQEIGRWFWSPAVAPFVIGERPNRVALALIQPPTWFAYRLRYDPAMRLRQLALFVRTDAGERDLLLEGDIASDLRQAVELRVNEKPRDRQDFERRFALQARIEAGHRYAGITVEASDVVTVTDVFAPTIEEPAFVRGKGFYGRERRGDETFRWIAPAAELMLHVPSRGATVRISGGVPANSYPLPATMTLEWNGARVGVFEVSGPFTFDQRLEAAAVPWATLRLTTSRQFVPNQVDHNGDTRVLSLWIDNIDLIP